MLYWLIGVGFAFTIGDRRGIWAGILACFLSPVFVGMWLGWRVDADEDRWRGRPE